MPTLTVKRILLSYDVPLVVLAKDEKNALYIGVNYGDSETSYAFYFSKSRSAFLHAFLEGSVDLHYLLVKKHIGKYQFGSGFGVLNEKIQTSPSDDLDKSLLPDVGMFMPTQADEATTARKVVHIDGRWGITDLRKFSDLVQDCYAFVFALTGRGESSTQRKMAELFQKYPWRGGFSAVNFFDDLYALIPPPQKVSIKKIQYASPGTIEMQINDHAARAIRSLCEEINSEDSSVVATYEEIHQWLRQSGWLGKATTEVDLDDFDKQNLLSVVKRLATTLGLESQQGYILGLANSDPLAAVKILLAYYRRLRGLADYIATGKATDLFLDS